MSESRVAPPFAFSREQAELRATVRRFLAETSPEAEVRRLMETERGYDRGVWSRLAGELGLAGLAVPERYGGSGFGFVDLQIVCEELGRALLCAPFLASAVLATQTLLASGDSRACAEYLPGLADGSVLGTLALTEASGRWTTDGLATAVEGGRLTGEKTYVLDGHVADLLLVVARAPAGPSLFAVDADAPGVHREPLPTLDATRRQARLTFDAAPARPIGVDGGAADLVERTLDRAAAALAAEQVGGARRVLEMAVDYATMRHQFGRPIGSFQAIKLKCAEMLLDVELATSAAYGAGWAVDADDPEAGVLAGLAAAHCSAAYRRCATENIQVHGGIGFTWEHPAHLYFKRATSSEPLFGAPREHRARVAHRLGF